MSAGAIHGPLMVAIIGESRFSVTYLGISSDIDPPSSVLDLKSAYSFTSWNGRHHFCHR
jgi:hypothetical protein